MDDDLQKVTLAFLQHEQMNEMAAYLNRGRSYMGLSDDDLRANWTLSFRRFAVTATRSVDMDDLSAEIAIRGLDLPMEDVRADFDALIAKMDALQVANGLDELGFDQKFGAFMQERGKPN